MTRCILVSMLPLLILMDELAVFTAATILRFTEIRSASAVNQARFSSCMMSLPSLL